MRKPIKDAVYSTKTERVEVEPAVYASVCAGCGDLFDMRGWNSEGDVSTLRGTFDRCATDKNGRSTGNMFDARVCGFACADKVMKGGWRNIEEYKPFANVDAVLVRCEIKVTALVARGEKEILATEQRRTSASGGSFYRVWPGQDRSVLALVEHLSANKEVLARIKAIADRTGVSEAEGWRLLEAEKIVASALELFREGRRPEGGDSIALGGFSGQSWPVWSWDAAIGALARAAGLLAEAHPEARGAGELTRDGWRVTREARGEKALTTRDLLELLASAEQLERDDINHETTDVAERAADGVELGMALLKLAEEKLGYQRTLKDELESEDEES